MRTTESLEAHVNAHKDSYNRYPLPLVTIAPSGEIVFVNDAAHREWLSANGPDEPLKGKPVLSLLEHPSPEPDNSGLLRPQKNYVRDVLEAAREGQLGRILVPIFTKQSGRRFIEVLPVFVRDDQGDVIGLELTAIDVTLPTIDFAENRLLIDIDRLTGLPNRRVFEHQMDRAQKDFARRSIPWTLIMADIDYFKTYNDTHGHPAGDRRICAAGQSIARAIRSNDVLTRYGGEEFAIILPETDTARALVIAERMRTAAQSIAIASGVAAQGDSYPGYSLSVGISTLSANIPTAQLLLETADAALYQAKQSGRNRIICTTSPSISLSSQE